MKKKIDINLILPIIVFSVGFILSSLGLIHFIQEYSRIGAISYDELRYEQLTFEKYKVVEVYKVGTVYEVYFEEYEEAFCVHPITQKKLNTAIVKELRAGTKLEIYYKNSTIKNSTVNYIFEICEMKDDNNICLALKDYKSAKQNQEMVGLIGFPILFLLCCVLLFITIKNRGLPPMRNGSR